ncbi:hypothetical protein N2152v2_006837 [Parachlorella kessleri]
MLPAASLTLLRQPETNNKVFLLGTSSTERAVSARHAGALAALLQPRLVALEHFNGYDAALVGEVDVTAPEKPPRMQQDVWEVAGSLLGRKQRVAALGRDAEARLRQQVLHYDVRRRLTQLLALWQRELQLPLMQDDVVDLQSGAVNITHYLRLTGLFSVPPARRPGKVGMDDLKVMLGELADFLRRLPWNLTGRGEPYEAGAEIRVAIKEAPPQAKFMSLRPTRDDYRDWANREAARGTPVQSLGKALQSAEINQQANILIEGVVLPEGVDASRADSTSASSYFSAMAHCKALEERHPAESRFLRWSSEHMADKLAAASAAPGNPISLAVVNDWYVPYMVQRWLDLASSNGAAAAADAAATGGVGRGPQQEAQQAGSQRGLAGKRGRQKKRR